jgi:hypothetical protein
VSRKLKPLKGEAVVQVQFIDGSTRKLADMHRAVAKTTKAADVRAALESILADKPGTKIGLPRYTGVYNHEAGVKEAPVIRADDERVEELSVA